MGLLTNRGGFGLPTNQTENDMTLTKEQKKKLKKEYLKEKEYEEWEKDNGWIDIDEELERCRTIYR